MNQLGKTTNSLVNYVYGETKPMKPKVGMGATLLKWTDRSPFTIHAIQGKKLWASQDKSERTDQNGMSESQDYIYSNNNQNQKDAWQLFTLRKDNKWHIGTNLQGNILIIGKREEYYDFSF